MAKFFKNRGTDWFNSILKFDKSGTLRTFSHQTTMDDLQNEGECLKALFSRAKTVTETLETWSLDRTLTVAQHSVFTV
jgi:hypothetical protein